MDVVLVLGRLGGVASRWQLLEAGVTAYELGRAVHDGRVRRVRRAWYALPGAQQEVVAAVRVGGMLTCVTLLRTLGIWTPPDDGQVHVSVADNASRLRSAAFRTVPRSADPSGVVVHWRPRPGATTRARDTVPGAIAHLQDCTDRDSAVAAIDAVLHAGGAMRSDLQAAGVRPALLALADARSESGGETFVRLRLRSMQLAFRSQVVISGVGRVDFLIGERLVLEVDGFAFHGDREAFERDRARDLALTSRGFVVVRVSYRQVMEEWPRIERALLACIRSNRHRLPASP